MGNEKLILSVLAITEWVLTYATLLADILYLVEVDDGEAVGLSQSHVAHSEVEPLRVLVGVEVKAQVEFVVPPATVCMNMYKRVYILVLPGILQAPHASVVHGQ